MAHRLINQTVLMSGADFFRVEELNPYSAINIQPDADRAASEHEQLRASLQQAGIKVVKVDAPTNCQDGIYTANWGLCLNNKVVLSSLPNKRQGEEPYAKKILSELGYELITPPFRFSGQGDALPCGDYLFVGSQYRTDPRMHEFLAQTFGSQVIGLETVPLRDSQNRPVINSVTGWPDSYFYDLDLALAVITPELIAWCPAAFTPASQAIIAGLAIEKISVSLTEAEQGFACNLVSTGETVVMSDQAPNLKRELENRGLQILTPVVRELSKGGGYIRCCCLTIS